MRPSRHLQQYLVHLFKALMSQLKLHNHHAPLRVANKLQTGSLPNESEPVHAVKNQATLMAKQASAQNDSHVVKMVQRTHRSLLKTTMHRS